MGDRAKLFWYSTPEFRYRDTVASMLLTEGYLAVERLDGRRERVLRSAITGLRRDGVRVIVGVESGEDAVFIHRADCEVELALLRHVHGASAEPWSSRNALDSSLFCLVGLVAVSAVFYHLIPATWSHGGHFLFGIASVLAAVFMIRPRRLRVDSLGVDLRIGIVPCLQIHLSTESLRAMEIVGVGMGKHARGRSCKALVIRLHQKRSWLWLHSILCVGRSRVSVRRDLLMLTFRNVDASVGFSVELLGLLRRLSGLLKLPVGYREDGAESAMRVEDVGFSEREIAQTLRGINRSHRDFLLSCGLRKGVVDALMDSRPFDTMSAVARVRGVGTATLRDLREVGYLYDEGAPLKADLQQ